MNISSFIFRFFTTQFVLLKNYLLSLISIYCHVNFNRLYQFLARKFSNYRSISYYTLFSVLLPSAFKTQIEIIINALSSVIFFRIMKIFLFSVSGQRNPFHLLLGKSLKIKKTYDTVFRLRAFLFKLEQCLL